jgi:acetyltransferase-like isoleucine patch superfamily enzyme
MIFIAETARVSSLADIEDSVRGSRIVIEEGAIIDSFVKIKPAGGIGDIIIGPGSIINSGCVLYTGHGIKIGANVLVAANCTFAPTNHEFRDPSRLIRDQGFMPSRGGVIVEDDVWIGAGTILLDGAILRRGSVVGAGSVVRSELGPYTINAGIPAKQVGKRA